MKHVCSPIVAAAIGLAAILLIGSVARAADAPAPLKGFDAFRFVKGRNVFDPDRRGMPSPQAARPPAPPRANTINLTGTMVADGKMLAFFSGSRSEFNKVVPIGSSIADFKVIDITNTQVDLERAGKKITVAVGKTVPLEGSSAATSPGLPPDSDTSAPAPDAPAASNAPAPDATSPNATASDASTPSEPKPAATPGDDQSEVLRRMMERRAKELSK